MYEIMRPNKHEQKRILNCKICPSFYEEIIESNNNTTISDDINQINISKKCIKPNIINKISKHKLNFITLI